MNAKARKNASGAKTPMSNKKYLLIWAPVLTVVAAVTVVANVAPQRRQRLGRVSARLRHLHVHELRRIRGLGHRLLHVRLRRHR